MTSRSNWAFLLLCSIQAFDCAGTGPAAWLCPALAAPDASRTIRRKLIVLFM
jgi:hypothetical protein